MIGSVPDVRGIEALLVAERVGASLSVLVDPRSLYILLRRRIFLRFPPLSRRVGDKDLWHIQVRANLPSVKSLLS